MSKLQKSSSFCVMCYETIESSNKTANTSDNLKWFVKILTKLAGRDKVYPIFILIPHKKLLECCNNCDEIINSFCKSYNQKSRLLMKTKLIFNELKEKISHVDNVPSKWNHITEVLEKTFGNDFGKIVESQYRISKFRQNIIDLGHHPKFEIHTPVLLNQTENVQLDKSSSLWAKQVGNYSSDENLKKQKELAHMNSLVTLEPTTIFKDALIPVRVDQQPIAENQNAEITEGNILTSISVPLPNVSQKNSKSEEQTTEPSQDQNNTQTAGLKECPECDKKLLSLHSLQVHLKYHLVDQNNLKCGYETCQSKFAHPANLQNHLTRNITKKNGKTKDISGEVKSRGILSRCMSNDALNQIKLFNQKNVQKTQHSVEDIPLGLEDSISKSNDDGVSNPEISNNEIADKRDFVTKDCTGNLQDHLINKIGDHQQINKNHSLENISTSDNTTLPSKLTPNDFECAEQPVELNQGPKFDGQVNAVVRLPVQSESLKEPMNWKTSSKTCHRKFATGANLQNYLTRNNGSNIPEKNKAVPEEITSREIRDTALNQDITLQKEKAQQSQYSLKKACARISTTSEINNDVDINSKAMNNMPAIMSTSDLKKTRQERKCQPKKPEFIFNKIKSYNSNVAHHCFENPTPNVEPVGLKCEVCTRKFTSYFMKEHHFKICHELARSGRDISYKCKKNDCRAYFLTSFQLRTHYRNEHGKIRKKATKEENKRFACSKCNKKFTRKIVFVLHQELHKDPSEWKWECETCEKKFASKVLLTQHTKIHAKYECRFCDKEFLYFDKFNEHLVKEHSNEDPATDPRNVEGGQISLKREFKTRKVTQVKPHILECKICKKTFSSLLRRDRHFKVTHDLSGICDASKVERCHFGACTAYFLKKDQLEYHRKWVHYSSEKVKKKIEEFKCKQCGKLFENESNMKMHVEFYKNSCCWEFECYTCGKKSRTKVQLMKHLLTHTNDKKPYRCEVCEEKFGSCIDLNSHLQKWHKDKNDSRGNINKRSKTKVYRIVQKRKIKRLPKIDKAF